MLTIRYFANVRETLGVDHETVELPAAATIPSLIATLASRHGVRWQQLTGATRLLVAVNQELVPLESVIKDGDEVAFFPPVTGG